MSTSDPIRSPSEPPADCPACPRLVQFRHDQRRDNPTWFNAPVPSFGDPNARLLVLGLAPGLKGANRTGRPFTGDYAGDLLYATLIAKDFARGDYAAHADDGLELVDVMISNAVRCVPPQNKPATTEIAACRGFLTARIDALPRLRAILALGRIAHDQALTSLGARKSAYPFAHGACHVLDTPRATEIGRATPLRLFDSYHCSRYNTSTRVLTPDMFRAVFDAIRVFLASDDPEPR
ncbi:MAG: uracil-DNA glycosylase [Rhizobiales bacterium]|nr:uracil-DNA glycosylase [Hyphomicrobiales bacterium]